MRYVLDYIAFSGGLITIYQFLWRIVAIVFIPIEILSKKFTGSASLGWFVIRAIGHYFLFGVILGFAVIVADKEKNPLIGLFTMMLTLLTSVFTCLSGIAALDQTGREAYRDGNFELAEYIFDGMPGVIYEAIAMPCLVLVGLFFPTIFLHSGTLFLNNLFADLLNVPFIGKILLVIGAILLFGLYAQGIAGCAGIFVEWRDRNRAK